MVKQLNHFIQGIRQALVLEPETEYQYPKRGDFARDAHALRGDAARVSSDLRSTLKKHGKQIENR